MQMHFVFSENVTLLFEFWTVQTLAGLILSCLVALVLTVVYEFSKVWKSNLLSRALHTFPIRSAHEPTPSSTPDPESSSNIVSDPLLPPASLPHQHAVRPTSVTVERIQPSSRWWFLHSFVALLHMAQVVLGYMLMLCVMSYNAAIFIAVLLGSGLGYFLAFPLLSKYPKPHVM
ncbi:probable low affinity copper uptake protein 2 isoform X2 [Xenopus laevis]|uniref:Copper transport protein n=1 Tax=Xenopus laevis TaxID=8355 RepID=A0A8J1LKF6_XENLA|nr:probable low affinity copper uptake protein 2 isoform X2 [Xenopus laevis]